MKRILLYLFALIVILITLGRLGFFFREKKVQSDYQAEMQVVDQFHDVQDQAIEAQDSGQWQQSLDLLEDAFQIDPEQGLSVYLVFDAIAHLPQDNWQQGFDLVNQMVDADATTCFEAFVRIGPSYAEVTLNY